MRARFSAAMLAALPGLWAMAATPAMASDGPLAVANLLCRFDTECIDTEGCADTTYEARIIVGDTPAGTIFAANARYEDDASTVDLNLLTVTPDRWLDEVTTLTSVEPGGRRLITRTPEGATWMTIHLNDGPMMISYRGQCEVSN